MDHFAGIIHPLEINRDTKARASYHYVHFGQTEDIYLKSALVGKKCILLITGSKSWKFGSQVPHGSYSVWPISVCVILSFSFRSSTCESDGK